MKTHKYRNVYWTECGIQLQRIGIVNYNKNHENGNAINVTEDKQDVTCKRCAKF